MGRGADPRRHRGVEPEIAEHAGRERRPWSRCQAKIDSKPSRPNDLGVGKCFDAHDGVVDMLREPVAEGLANIRIPLADEVVGGCEAGEVGHDLQVPDDDTWFHTNKL